MLIIRIVTAAAILTGASPVRPAVAAHIVPIDRASEVAGVAPLPAVTCPLRAWPYIG